MVGVSQAAGGERQVGPRTALFLYEPWQAVSCSSVTEGSVLQRGLGWGSAVFDEVGAGAKPGFEG